MAWQLAELIKTNNGSDDDHCLGRLEVCETDPMPPAWDHLIPSKSLHYQTLLL